MSTRAVVMKADAGPHRNKAEQTRIPSFDQMYTELRRRICTLDIAPGAVLSENKLAEEFGASRTPVRKVLHRLEFDGLLVSKHGVGTIVTTVDMLSLWQVYALRLTLIDFIVELPPDQVRQEGMVRLAEVRAEVVALEAEVARAGSTLERLRSLSELYMQFNEVLSWTLGSQPLREIADRLFYQTMRVYTQLLPRLGFDQEVKAILEETAEITAHLEARDLAGLAQQWRYWLEACRKRMSVLLH